MTAQVSFRDMLRISTTDDGKSFVTISKTALDTLEALLIKGPTWDGDVLSKAGRDELLDIKLAAKIIAGNDGGFPDYGYQAATYLGARVYTTYQGASTLREAFAIARQKREKEIEAARAESEK